MTTECELISIIVPVYNVENYLPRCLETIAAQTYRNLEIILVDDGSTDRSGSICDEFAKKDYRAWVIHQQNMGQSGARNTGKEIASGEYIMFVDGDDYLHVDAVNTLWAAINSDSEYDLAIVGFLKTHKLDEDIHSKSGEKTVSVARKELMRLLLVSDNDEEKLLFNVVWSKLYRKDKIANLCFENRIISEDTDFNLKAYLLTDKAIVIYNSLYFYVQRPGSIVHSKNSLNNHHSTRSVLFYTHFKNWSDRNKKDFGHLLLRAFYRNMTLWKGRTYQTDAENETFQKCREYERDTRWAYWLNWRINPIEKIGVTTLLHCPRLTRWLLIKTKNW